MKKTDTTTSVGALDKVVNRVSQFTKIQRILICVVMFVACGAAFTLMSYKPKFDEYAKLGEDLAALEQKLADYQKVANDLDKVRELKEEAEQNYKKGLRLLPDQEEMPELVDGMSKAAKEVNVEVLNFLPHDKVAGTELYAVKPIDMEVSGSYHNIALFLDRISKLFRIVVIKEFRITPLKSAPQAGQQGAAVDSSMLQAAMKAETYMFVESKPGEGNEGGKDAGKEPGKEAPKTADEKAKPK